MRGISLAIHGRMSIRIETFISADGLSFLKRCYRFVNAEWQPVLLKYRLASAVHGP